VLSEIITYTTNGKICTYMDITIKNMPLLYCYFSYVQFQGLPMTIKNPPTDTYER